MADPQDELKRWLGDQLKAKGPDGQKELAQALGVPADAVRRMRNRDGSKETRRIEAHHIPVMAGFFGTWPPGFEQMSDTEEQAEELAKTAKGKAGGRGRAKKKTTELNSSKDLVVQNVAGPVTVIDNSDNAVGDANTIAGNTPSAPVREGAAELMGQVNLAVSEIYKKLKRKLPLDELGRVAYERHAAILAACQDPEEYQFALEIMKLRLERELTEEDEARPAN